MFCLLLFSFLCYSFNLPFSFYLFKTSFKFLASKLLVRLRNEEHQNQNSDTVYNCFQPPIHFLGNFKTPCWYEPISWDGFSKGHPYVENLFACFARNARTVFKELLSEWMLRATIQTNPKRLRCMPYFYIVGQPKCGSTDLYFKITLHPDVVRPPMKEPHWWSKNRFGKCRQTNVNSLTRIDAWLIVIG